MQYDGNPRPVSSATIGRRHRPQLSAVTGSIGSGPPDPGWFPDPWGAGTYRWWDGRAWTTALHHGEPGRSDRTTRLRRVVLVAAAACFGLWCAVWAVILPLLLVNDADNGRLAQDLLALWLPEFVLGAVGVVVSVVACDPGLQTRLKNRVLLLPGAVLAALVVASVVIRVAHG